MTGKPLVSRANWTVNDDGDPVPRRTHGSIANGYTSKDFTLVCKYCGDDFGNEPDLPLGVAHAHFQKHHPEHLGPKGTAIQLVLLWLGRGPAPRSSL